MFFICFKDTLPETDELHLKMDAWNTIVSFWGPSLLNFRNVPSEIFHVRHEKKLITFHYTSWLIGILLTVYYNLYIPG